MTTEKITPFWPTPAAAHDHLADAFPEDLGNRRFVAIDPSGPSLRELAAKINITALPRGGVMLSGSTDQLREYITRDIEASEELKKRFEVDQVITDALAMQARGRAAPLPRPKPLDVYVQHAVDNWSDYK